MGIQKELNTLPFIIKAAEEIWFDNGMVNRFEPLEQKLSTLNKWLSLQPTIFIENIEFELSKLTDDQLHTVCCGEESEAESLASKYLMDFLTTIFNEEYEAQAIPEGFVLVPKSLPDEIYDKVWGDLEGVSVFNSDGDGFVPLENIDLGEMYKAMIETAEGK